MKWYFLKQKNWHARVLIFGFWKYPSHFRFHSLSTLHFRFYFLCALFHDMCFLSFLSHEANIKGHFFWRGNPRRLWWSNGKLQWEGIPFPLCIVCFPFLCLLSPFPFSLTLFWLLGKVILFYNKHITSTINKNVSKHSYLKLEEETSWIRENEHFGQEGKGKNILETFYYVI